MAKVSKDGYIDIDIHKEQYKGSKNDLENPNLEIHKVNAEDEVKYRLEVKTKSFTEYSNTITLKVFSVSETPRIRLISNRIKKTYNAGENIVIKVDIENPSSVLCTLWQRKTVDGSQAINIALPKFKGTKSTTEEHVLCINDCDESDMTNGPYFLLAVCSGDKKEEIHSDLIHLNIVKDHLLMSLSFEVLKEEETPIHERKVLYHGCVELKADVKGFPNVSGVVWMKDSKVLDLGKYEGSCCDSDLAFLRINMVTKNDEGIYVCKIRSQDVPMDNETSETMDEQTSDMVKIIVIGDVPKVTLNTSTQYEPVTYGSTMILEAQIESSPPPTDIQWKKDRNIIKPDGRKFFEVESDAYNPKLRVENVDFTDSGTYCIAITNALGSDKDLKEIKVRVNKLFISGPVVVSSSKNIVFKTIIPKNSKVEHAKWMISRNQCTTSTEIGFGKPGYSTSTFCGVVQTQTMSIPNVRENIGEYHLDLNNLKSNIINVFAYDSRKFSTEQEENCLRFFALQDISRKALRIKFDKIVMPAEFNQKWKEFETNCKRNKKTYMLPDKTPSNSNDLDVSSLCAMIQFFLNKTSSAKRSEKDLKVKYKEIANDVERIRKHRNNLCHASSSEMETGEFNDAVIDLIEVIQRLSDDNEDLATEIYNILNNVFTKGKEMDRMMENFKVFIVEARQSEKQLRKFEGKNEDIPQWVQDHDEISFHHWYPSSVVMFEKNTIAFRRWEGKNGVCFMNRPLNSREEIFVHRVSVSSKILKFGLTNRDPKTLKWSEEFADLSGIQYHEKAWHPEEKCYACFSLIGNSSLIVSFDDSGRNQQVYEFNNVTGNNPLWLAFDICEIGDIFQISKKKTPTLQNLSQIYMSFWPWPF